MNNYTNRHRNKIISAAAALVLLIVLAPVLFIPLRSQTKLNLTTQAKPLIDFSSFNITKPVSVVSSLPGSCVLGQLSYWTGATAGQNLYGCTAANVWTQLSGGGGSVSLPWTTLGDTVYYTGSAAARLAGPTTTGTYVLTESPSGSAVAPAWTQQYTLTSGLGASVTGTGNLQVNTSEQGRVVSGTTDTLTNADCGGNVYYTSTSAVTVALPQANLGGNFVTGCRVTLTAYGAGAVTVSASTSLIGPTALAISTRVIGGSSGSGNTSTFHSCSLVSNSANNYDLKNCN